MNVIGVYMPRNWMSPQSCLLFLAYARAKLIVKLTCIQDEVGPVTRMLDYLAPEAGQTPSCAVICS